MSSFYSDEDLDELDELDAAEEQDEGIDPAPISFDCDVLQAFDFDHLSQARIGHITALKIAQKEFPADLLLENPCDPPENPPSARVVAAIDKISWGGGPFSRMTITFRMSKQNRAEIPQLIMRATTAGESERDVTKVEIAFNIYEYDSAKHKYFLCFHTNEARIKGQFQTASASLSGGGDFTLIDLEEKYRTGSVTVEGVSLTITPAAEDAHLQLAFGAEMPFVKEWGKSSMAEEEGVADLFSDLTPEERETRRAAAERKRQRAELEAKRERRRKKLEEQRRALETLSKRSNLTPMPGESREAFRQRVGEYERIRRFEYEKLKKSVEAQEARLAESRRARREQQSERDEEELEGLSTLFGEGLEETGTSPTTATTTSTTDVSETLAPVADLEPLVKRLDALERAVAALKSAPPTPTPTPAPDEALRKLVSDATAVIADHYRFLKVIHAQVDALINLLLPLLKEPPGPMLPGGKPHPFAPSQRKLLLDMIKALDQIVPGLKGS